jgi:hypothetical protein
MPVVECLRGRVSALVPVSLVLHPEARRPQIP